MSGLVPRGRASKNRDPACETRSGAARLVNDEARVAMIRSFSITTPGQGLHPITPEVEEIVRESGIDQGLCTVFITHTSASLLIQENADPSAKRDLERWLNRLVPEQDTLFSHTSEGPDDMPSHIKSALTSVSIGIPITGGELLLGTWQGIYLWEHRRTPHRRSIAVSIISG